MEFKIYLKDKAEQTEIALSDIFKQWRAEAEKLNSNLLPLIDVSIKACAGGKRLRAALVILGYELAGGLDNQEIAKPAAAFEIFQTAILAHDDIIDKSPLRRGKPTMFMELGGDHYGISQSICLADIGFFQSMQLISGSDFPVDLKNKALQSFSKTMIETALGEVLDIELPRKNEEKSEEDVITIAHLKTARYTITGPMQLGAILAGAKEPLLDNLKNFGDNLGIAYQIQDDILGVFGDEITLGKSITSDIEEGKNTLLIVHALKNANHQQREVLNKHYGKGIIGDKESETIRNIFKDTHALDYSRTKELEYVSSAKKVIPKITKDLEKQNLLNELADFLVERIK